MADEIRLYTERLCLRVPASQDAEALYDLFADAEVMQGLGKEPVDRRLASGRVWCVHSRDTGNRPAGGRASWADDLRHARLDALDLGKGWNSRSARAWLGFDAGTVGTRYATEAAAAIRDCAYERPDIDRLVSLIAPDNVRSQRVARRLAAIPTETVTPEDSKRTAVVWRHQRID